MSRWKNINADSGEKTWLTPKHIIDALGHFDTDPCCPPNMPWRTADRMLTKSDDGTTSPWIGRVWCNPPYGREAIPFLRRMSCYEGGGLSSSLRELTRTHGNRSSSRLRTQSSSSRDDFASAGQMGRMVIVQQPHQLLFRIHSSIRMRFQTVESKEHL